MVQGVSEIGSNFQQIRNSYSVEVKQSAKNNIKHQNNSQKTSARDIWGTVAGAGVGLAVPSYTLYDSVRKLSGSDAKYIAELMQMLMPEADKLERTKDVAEKIIEETGLKSKGVKVNFIDGTEASLNHLREVIATDAPPKNAFGRRMGSNYFETFKHGANAAFFPDANEVVVNSKNLYTSVYHEIGHAMNKNGNFFTKALQKARVLTPFGVSIIAPIVLAVGLLHKVNKTKPQNEKGKVEKTLDFVSENAGKLTLASYAPMLAEEGLASIRGLKLASKHLPKDVIKKLGFNYMKAWGTYALLAGAVAGGVALGINVANKIKNKGPVAPISDKVTGWTV